MFLKSNRTNWANERFRAAPAPIFWFISNEIRTVDTRADWKWGCVRLWQWYFYGGAPGDRRRRRRINNYVSVLEKTINEEEGSVKPIVKTLVTPHEKLTVCHFVATFFCFKISAALKLCVSISTNRFARKVLCVYFLSIVLLCVRFKASFWFFFLEMIFSYCWARRSLSESSTPRTCCVFTPVFWSIDVVFLHV